MNQLQVFSNEEFGSVRTLLIGNEPYFVGKNDRFHQMDTEGQAADPRADESSGV